jgi:hypothetical protein
MDKTALAALFSETLSQWQCPATCTPQPQDVSDLGIDMRLDDGRRVSLCRDDTTGSRLPVWRLQIDDQRPMEAGSIRVVFAVLRTELDESYRPAKMIMGMQPGLRLAQQSRADA